MLTIKEIEKSYEGKPLLRKVSFEVYEDETVCLLGPSGSGKSTLLRIIAGLEKPEGGRVFWQGKDVTKIPPHKRGFGLMFQHYALFPHRSVAENIAFGLRMQDLPKDEIKVQVADALETINMQEFADRKVTELSGGEQQRVALARALAPNPHLLMLDEPLGALDRTLREQLGRELRRILRETKVPAVYVTHDQEEAYSIADRLLLLHNGTILQSGRPHEIYHHPQNVWVAEFFGLGNLIKGEVIKNSPLPLKVKTPLGIIQASCDDDLPEIGITRTLLLRPSHACLDQKDCPNQITGKVVDQVFQGENYRLTLYCSDTVPSFTIWHPKPVKIGQELSVGYQPEDILCLKDEA